MTNENLAQKNLEEMIPSSAEERHKNILNEHYRAGLIYAKEHDMKGLEIALNSIKNHYWDNLQEIENLNPEIKQGYIQKTYELYNKQMEITKYHQSLDI